MLLTSCRVCCYEAKTKIGNVACDLWIRYAWVKSPTRIFRRSERIYCYGNSLRVDKLERISMLLTCDWIGNLRKAFCTQAISQNQSANTNFTKSNNSWSLTYLVCSRKPDKNRSRWHNRWYLNENGHDWPTSPTMTCVTRQTAIYMYKLVTYSKCLYLCVLTLGTVVGHEFLRARQFVINFFLPNYAPLTLVHVP